MEIETSLMPAASRANLMHQIRRFRSDLGISKRSFRQEQLNLNDNISKEMLIGGLQKNDKKERLLNKELIPEQDGLLLEARRCALEAEGTAISTLTELRGQREKLQRSMMKNREIHEELYQGNRLLSLMQNRAIQTKLMMYGIFIMLICMVVVLLYLRIA